MKKGTVKIRGIRSPVPSGHLIGNTAGGAGDPHPIQPRGALALKNGKMDVAFTGDVIVDGVGATTVKALGGVPIATGIKLPSFTVSTLPSASPAGRMIYVSNEAGGATIAFSDGTNWRRAQDRAIVS